MNHDRIIKADYANKLATTVNKTSEVYVPKDILDYINMHIRNAALKGKFECNINIEDLPKCAMDYDEHFEHIIYYDNYDAIKTYIKQLGYYVRSTDDGTIGAKFTGFNICWYNIKGNSLSDNDTE